MTDPHVLNVEQVDPLSENLRLVIVLNAQTLERVTTPEALFEQL
ncbi:MAG: hypothetical protein WBV18_13040 [Methyloceanibacter sp.]|jgi:hypothetical protein